MTDKIENTNLKRKSKIEESTFKKPAYLGLLTRGQNRFG